MNTISRQIGNVNAIAENVANGQMSSKRSRGQLVT